MTGNGSTLVLMVPMQLKWTLSKAWDISLRAGDQVPEAGFAAEFELLGAPANATRKCPVPQKVWRS